MSTIPVNIRASIDDPLLAVFAEQARLASPGIVHPDAGTIWGIAQRMLERITRDDWRPEEAAKNAAAELREAGVGQ